MSPTSNFSSTVLFGVSKSPFATMIWKDGAGPSFTMDWGANRRIFLRSSSGIALEWGPVSIRSSRVNSPKSIGKYSIRRLNLSPRFAERGTYDGSPSLATKKCKKTVSSKRLLEALWSSCRCVTSTSAIVASKFGCQRSIRARDSVLSGIAGSSSSSVGG